MFRNPFKRRKVKHRTQEDDDINRSVKGELLPQGHDEAHAVRQMPTRGITASWRENRRNAAEVKAVKAYQEVVDAATGLYESLEKLDEAKAKQAVAAGELAQVGEQVERQTRFNRLEGDYQIKEIERRIQEEDLAQEKLKTERLVHEIDQELILQKKRDELEDYHRQRAAEQAEPETTAAPEALAPLAIRFQDAFDFLESVGAEIVTDDEVDAATVDAVEIVRLALVVKTAAKTKRREAIMNRLDSAREKAIDAEMQHLLELFIAHHSGEAE